MNLVSLFVKNSQSITANTNQTARRKAVRSALMSVANVHPEYAGVGFDEKFMTNQAAEIMEPFFTEGALPTANALLTAWAAQFPYSTESAQQAVANIAPMAKEFVYVLASEASNIPVVARPAAIYPAAIYPAAIYPDSIHAGSSYLGAS